MTWYADEILLPASSKAVDRIRQDPRLRPFAYAIKSLDDYPWYRPEHKHNLPSNGLLVVRPVCSLSRDGDWYDEPILDWRSLTETSQLTANLDQEVEQVLGDYVDDQNIPPRQFRGFLSGLAIEIGLPVLYYACSMWGGDFESEYCLCYSPDEIVVRRQIGSKSGNQDALKAGLALIDINLQSGFFAPHTRGFPWHLSHI